MKLFELHEAKKPTKTKTKDDLASAFDNEYASPATSSDKPLKKAESLDNSTIQGLDNAKKSRSDSEPTKREIIKVTGEKESQPEKFESHKSFSDVHKKAQPDMNRSASDWLDNREKINLGISSYMPGGYSKDRQVGKKKGKPGA